MLCIVSRTPSPLHVRACLMRAHTHDGGEWSSESMQSMKTQTNGSFQAPDNTGHSRSRFTHPQRLHHLRDSTGHRDICPFTMERETMKHFAIPPLGMTQEDIERLDAQFDEKLAQQQDFLLAYYSEPRKTVLFAWTLGGQAQGWLMMPCASRDAMGVLQAWYAGEVASQLREQENGAAATTVAELDRIRKPFG